MKKASCLLTAFLPMLCWMPLAAHAQGLSIGAGTTLSLGASTFRLGGDWHNAGTFAPGTGTVVLNGHSAQTISGANTFYTLIIEKDHPSDTVNATGSILAVANGLLVTSGSLTSAPDLHDVSIGADGTLALSGDCTVSGDWNNGGTFLHDSHSVTLDGTDQEVAGSTTFHDLTKVVTAADTLTFAAGSTTTVAATLTLQGAIGQRLSLRSSSPGTAWYIDPQATRTIAWLDIMDSHNQNALDIDAGARNILPSGNNVKWLFDEAPMVATQAATGVGATTAVFNGTIDDLGYPAPSYGICWNTSGDPTIADTILDLGMAAATGAFSVSLTGLDEKTTYYVRTYAINALGPVYGEVRMFTTSEGYFTVSPDGKGGALIIYWE